jgi:hypothetical protein
MNAEYLNPAVFTVPIGFSLYFLWLAWTAPTGSGKQGVFCLAGMFLGFLGFLYAIMYLVGTAL